MGLYLCFNCLYRLVYPLSIVARCYNLCLVCLLMSLLILMRNKEDTFGWNQQLRAGLHQGI
jgi:hypothetical protein